MLQPRCCWWRRSFVYSSEAFYLPMQVCWYGSNVCKVYSSVKHDLKYNDGLCLFRVWPFSTSNQPWLSPANLEVFANTIHQKGAPLTNCWGFVDGTVKKIARPEKMRRVLYNGHKKVYALKFQSIVAPDGLCASLVGPVEGERHDSGMLRESDLLNQLQQHCFTPNGHVLCIYGDPAYPLRQHLQAPFRSLQLTQLQIDYNKAMSQVRTSVEWVLGDISNFLRFWILRKIWRLAWVLWAKCTKHVHYSQMLVHVTINL